MATLKLFSKPKAKKAIRATTSSIKKAAVKAAVRTEPPVVFSESPAEIATKLPPNAKWEYNGGNVSQPYNGPWGVTTAMLSLYGMPTGCGLGAITGIITPALTKTFLKKALDKAKQNGYGALIATLGQNYSHHEENILKLGFKKLCTYKNWAHGSSYTQSLYVIGIEQELELHNKK